MFFYNGETMKCVNEDLLKRVLDYVETYQIREGKSPTYRDIARALKMNSTSVAHRYVNLLSLQGYLSKDDEGKIEIKENLAPSSSVIAPMVGTVRCGAPIFASENIEESFSLPTEIFGKGKIFLLKAEGDSMVDAGINEGDIIVVTQTCQASDGEIVVALIDDSATVKRFYKKADHVVLHPENKKYDDIICQNVTILGVVKHLIRNF